MFNLGNDKHEEALGLCYWHLQNKLSTIVHTTSYNISSTIAYEEIGILPRALPPDVNHSFCCEVPPMENWLWKQVSPYYGCSRYIWVKRAAWERHKPVRGPRAKRRWSSPLYSILISSCIPVKLLSLQENLSWMVKLLRPISDTLPQMDYTIATSSLYVPMSMGVCVHLLGRWRIWMQILHWHLSLMNCETLGDIISSVWIWALSPGR